MALLPITEDDLELGKQILEVSQRQINNLQQRINTEKTRDYSSTYGQSVIEMCQQQLNCAQSIFNQERNLYNQLKSQYHAQFQNQQIQINETKNSPKTKTFQQKQTKFHNNIFAETLTPPTSQANIPVYTPATNTPSPNIIKPTTLNLNISQNSEQSQVTWLSSPHNSLPHTPRLRNNNPPFTPNSPSSTNNHKTEAKIAENVFSMHKSSKSSKPNLPKTDKHSRSVSPTLTTANQTSSIKTVCTNEQHNEFVICSKKEESIEIVDVESIDHNNLSSPSPDLASPLPPIEINESFSRQETSSFLPRMKSVQKTNAAPKEVGYNEKQTFRPLATAVSLVINDEQKEIVAMQFERAVTPIITTDDEIESTAVERIDQALGEYYQSMRGENSNYYNNNAGLFAEWCDENGYDDDGVADELGINADPTECAFTDFTDDFPFNTNISLNKEQEKLEIFKILQHCYKYGFDIRIKYGFDPLTDLSVTNMFLSKYLYHDKEFEIDYDLTQNDLDKTRRIYIGQCDGVFGKKILTDLSFEYGLAIGIKNNYFPFMQYLVDVYCRYFFQLVLKDIHKFKEVEIKMFLRKNTKLNRHKVEELIGAIDIYTRICPTMLVTKPLTTINDNIYDIIKYLIISNDIIQLIMDESTDENIQFQFDITIACNSVHSTQRVCSLLFDELEDDNDEEESDDAVDGPYEDVLGNVYRKLNGNKLKNINVTLSARRKPENMDKFEEIDELDKDKLIHLCSEIFNITSTTQEMDELNYNQKFIFMKNERFQNNNFSELCNVFSKFRLLSLQKTLDAIYKDLDISEILLFNIIDFELDINSIKQWLSKMLDINQKKNHFEQDKHDIMNAYKKFACLYKDNDERKQSYNSCNYPIKHRINMFIDRRSNNFENKEKHNYFDDIIFYECPSGSNMLPLTKNNEMVHESFFNLTQKCLIPKIGYVDGENEAIHTLNMQTQERIRNSTISCRTAPPGGNVLIFSFHIIAKDIIKCYLFRDAQCTRFLPQDIKHVLTHLFNKDYNTNNNFYKNDKQIYSMISKLTYSDKLFKYWFNNRAKNV